LSLLGAGAQASPAVVTLALPPQIGSVELGEAMQDAGYLLSCNSDYLRERNWIQVSLLGECTREEVTSLLDALGREVGGRRGVTPVEAPR